MTTNVVGPAGIPRYFQFDVPTNGQPAAAAAAGRRVLALRRATAT